MASAADLPPAEPSLPWWRRRPDLMIVIALPVHALGLWLLSFAPGVVDVVYGRALYPVIVRVQSVFDLTPISPACVALAAAIGLALAWARRVHRARPEAKQTWARLLGSCAWRLLVVTALVGHAFPIVWGLNYWRPALPDRLGLDLTDAVGVADTSTLIVERTNAARIAWPAEPRIGAYDAPIAAAVHDLLVELGLDHASIRRRIRFVPEGMLSISSFHGVVIPYTTEGWVDAATDVRYLPFAIAHEKAHQAGVAREADANLIAFLALARHPDPYLRYSALFYVVDAFENHSRTKPSADVQRDRGIAVQVAQATQVQAVTAPTRKVYDAYLKVNKVEAGIGDYDRVTLLIHGWIRKHPRWFDER